MGGIGSGFEGGACTFGDLQSAIVFCDYFSDCYFSCASKKSNQKKDAPQAPGGWFSANSSGRVHIRPALRHSVAFLAWALDGTSRKTRFPYRERSAAVKTAFCPGEATGRLAVSEAICGAPALRPCREGPRSTAFGPGRGANFHYRAFVGYFFCRQISHTRCESSGTMSFSMARRTAPDDPGMQKMTALR